MCICDYNLYVKTILQDLIYYNNFKLNFNFLNGIPFIENCSVQYRLGKVCNETVVLENYSHKKTTFNVGMYSWTP